jgi:hypothetical protein
LWTRYAEVNCPVSKRKKMRRFRAATAVKSAAREIVGAPPAVRREENKKRGKEQKHKATLGKLLVDRDSF